MHVESYISQAIDATQKRNAYDAEIKLLLSDKMILSWIIKYCVSEFSGYSPEEICTCIEGEPEVAKRSVFQRSVPEAIVGMNTESSIPGEGKVTYDIRFYVLTPDKKHVKSIMNLEAPEREKEGLPVHRLLNVLLSRTLSPEEKKRIIREEFGIATTVKLEGRQQGLQEGRQQGRQQGIQQGALNTLVFLVNDGLLSVDVAAERTNMTKEEFEKILIES